MQQTIRNVILLGCVALYLLPASEAKDGIFSTADCLHFLKEQSFVWNQSKASALKSGLSEGAASELANRVVRMEYLQMRTELRIMEESFSRTLLSHFRSKRYFEQTRSNWRQIEYQKEVSSMRTEPIELNHLSVFVPNQAPFFSDILANAPPMSEEATRQLELILSLRTMLATARTNLSLAILNDAPPDLRTREFEPEQMSLLNEMANEETAVRSLQWIRQSARNLLGTARGDAYVTNLASKLNDFTQPSVENLWSSHQQYEALVKAPNVPDLVKEEMKWEARFERKYGLPFNPLRAHLLQAYCDYFDIRILYESDESRVP